ncbi:hypothetical protein D3C84_567050 [compost metagenome]
MKRVRQVVLLVTVGHRHVEWVRYRGILQTHQVLLGKRDAPMCLLQQLDKATRLIFGGCLTLNCERILGFGEIGPTDRPIHHSRRQARNELPCPAKDVMLQ